jgi:hypothetical protein
MPPQRVQAELADEIGFEQADAGLRHHIGQGQAQQRTANRRFQQQAGARANGGH